MKNKVCVGTILLLLAAFTLYAMDSTNPLQVRSTAGGSMMISLQTPQLVNQAEKIAQTDYQRLSMPDASLTGEDGYPELPFYSTTIAIPPTGNYEIRVNAGNYRVVNGIKPYPVIPDGTAPEAFNVNRAAYEGTGLYPQRIMQNSQPAIMRDFRVLQISINPVQWDAGAQELRVYDNIELEISFNDEPGINELPGYSGYDPNFEKLYASIISNFNDYRILGQELRHSRILLIHGTSTDQAFLQQLAQFVAWKRQKGHEVNIVTTTQTGSSNTSIKNYIQAQYNNLETRPDYIILLGDTTGTYAIPGWTETWSSYQGGGDYPYTHLAGNDTLGDVYIGRISAENLSQLSVLFNKIYTYEKNVNIDPVAAAWLNRMVLVGDPSSSGISTKYVNKFIKEMALQVNPNYTFIENYTGGYSTTMNSGVNQGVGFFNYRGYIGMSGWSPSSSLVNGVKMPHATILTCGTGNYLNGTADSETFMRLGTVASPAGAITATGMSTSGTHTMFNNTLAGGIYDGILTYHMRTMGEAILNGKLYLNNTYSATNPNQVNYFAHWCNLMGDPTVEVYVGIPGGLELSAAPTIPSGTSVYDVTVTNNQGEPVEGVSVTVWSNSSSAVVAKGFTNSEGFISLFLPTSLGGDCVVTASRHDYKPTQMNMIVESAGSLVYYDKSFFDNNTQGSFGNGDGFANAGETIALFVNVRNSTSATINGITAQLSTNDPALTVLQGASSYPNLEPTDNSSNPTAYLISINHNIDPMHDSRFTLNLTDDQGNQYETIFHLATINAALDFGTYSINAGGNNILDPAENATLHVSIHNSSTFGAFDIWGELVSLNDLVVVTDSVSFFGLVPAGSNGASIDGFGLFARALLIPGMQIPFRLRLYNDTGFEQIVNFNIPVGTPSQNTPLGPDAYGYFIYDVTDTAYPDCPTYDWIEIHPSQGGSGSLITGLNDQGISGDEGDQVGSTVVQVIDLPFNFGFYGVEYDQITVCVNGFIAMGASENGEFRNYRLPGAMGPSPMIAAFWDDLTLRGDAGIYRYYNSNEHYFVVEYYKMRNGYDLNTEETFQVIFYDPMFYPTGLGDGMIKIQYKVFNNIDVGGGGYSPVHGNYSTIGIKDHTNTRGLEYTYNNQYPPTAAPLSNNKALMITTMPVLHQNAHLVIGELIVSDSNGNGIVEPGETAELGIKLNNIGINDATEVQLVGAVSNPNVTVINNTSAYNNIEGSNYGINISPLKFQISPNCPNNHTVTVICNITINGNSWQYPVNFTVFKPALTLGKVYLNDTEANGNGMAEPGETIKLIVNYTNNTTVDATNITSYISVMDPNVTISNLDVLFDRIPAGATAQAVYGVHLSENVTLGNFITFYLTYLGDLIDAQNQQIMLSVGNTGMSEDFETDDGQFVASPATGGWEWGGSAYAGAHSGVAIWGTRLNSNYNNNQVYTLVSPSVFIGSNFALEFYHRYDFEDYYDGGNVKISTNNGSTWTLLTPEGGYPEDQIAAMGEPGYSNVQAAWTLARFPLSAYANQNVRFKWTMASDQGVQAQGWFIDDVQTNGFIDFAGLVTGEVVTGNTEQDFSEINLKASNNMITSPLDDGIYKLYLPAGNYTLEASGRGYQTQNSTSFSISLANQIEVKDFVLGYLPPVQNFAFTVTGDQVSLTWAAPVEPWFPVQGYNVYRKVNAGRFELLGVISELSFSQQIPEIGTYKYYVEAKYAEGNSIASPVIGFSYPYVDGEENNNTLVTKLFGCYPNPFNPETNIRFSLRESGRAQLSIYNMRGQLVKTLVDANLSSGTHTLVWDGRDNSGRSVSSGVYFYRLIAPGYTMSRKAILMK